MKDGVPWRERARLKREAQRRELIRKPRDVKSGFKKRPLHPPVTPAPKHRRLPPEHNPHKPRGVIPWDVPDRFRGRVFCIVGGGPSLKSEATREAMAKAAQDYPDVVWIAVNNSYEIAPWADILHFADAAWWEWNHRAVKKVWKKIVTTATSEVKPPCNDPMLRRFWRDRNQFTTDKQKLHGFDSGTQAVNLAFHLGASKIVLWGIDMCVPAGETPQWHTKHRRATRVENYLTKFAPTLAESVRRLGELGVPVVRATDPGIPEAPLTLIADALASQATGGQP